MTLTSKAVLFGLAVAGCAGLLVLVSLHILAGPEWYSGHWALSDQLGFGQTVATFLAIWLAAALGWYAIQQYLLTIRARGEAELAEGRRLLEGLMALQHALEHNRTQFEALDSMLMPGLSPWEHQLDTAVWDAVSLDILPRLHDPQLAADLAQHFAFVQQLGVLIERRTGPEQNRNPDTLGTYIRSRMRELDSHAAQLQRRVEAALNAVTPYGY
jgi:hypothetical protein